MLKRDYLIKQFEEFGKALAQLLSHKREQDYDKFEQEISLALKKFSDQDLLELESMTLADFQYNIIEKTDIEFEKKKIIARVLFEKMSYYLLLGIEERSNELKNKCLLLYQHIQSNATENEYDLDVHYKLNYLKGETN